MNPTNRLDPAPLLAAAILFFGASAQEVDATVSQSETGEPPALGALRETAELGQATDVLKLFADELEGPLGREGEAVALVARARFDVGEEEKAFALVRGARPRPGTEVFVELEHARLLLLTDRLEEALERLTTAVPSGGRRPRFPDHAPAWLLIARLQARRGEQARAVGPAERFLALAPHHPEAYRAWHILGQAAVERGDVEAAHAYLAKAEETRRWAEFLRARRIQVSLRPEEPLPRLGLALVWHEVGEHEHARAILLELVRLHPDFSPGWFRLGQTEHARGDAERALQSLDRALACAAQEPESEAPQVAWDARLEKGFVLLTLGRGEAGIQELEGVVAAGAERVGAALLLRAHERLFREYRERGETARAEVHARAYRGLGGDPLE